MPPPGVSAAPSPGVWYLPRLHANSLAACALFTDSGSEAAGHLRRHLTILRPPCWKEAQITQRVSTQHMDLWEKHIQVTQAPAVQSPPWSESSHRPNLKS